MKFTSGTKKVKSSAGECFDIDREKLDSYYVRVECDVGEISTLDGYQISRTELGNIVILCDIIICIIFGANIINLGYFINREGRNVDFMNV